MTIEINTAVIAMGIIIALIICFVAIALWLIINDLINMLRNK